MSIQATNNNKKFKINKLSTQNKNKYIVITRRTQMPNSIVKLNSEPIPIHGSSFCFGSLILFVRKY